MARHIRKHEISPTYEIVEKATKAIREMPWSEFVATIASKQRKKLLNDLHAAVEAVLTEVEAFKKRYESRNR